MSRQTDIPACRVSPEKHYPRLKEPGVRAALLELATSVNAVDGWLSPCVDGLTVTDVHATLEALSLRDRTRVFRELGLKLQPRSITTTLSQHAVSLLRKAPVGSAGAVVSILCGPAWHDLVVAAFADAGDDLRDQFKTVRPVSDWSPAVLRGAIWTNRSSSGLTARMWAWASDQDWFVPPGLSADDVGPVIAAARHVVELTPDYQPFPAPRQRRWTDASEDTVTEAVPNRCEPADGVDADSGESAELPSADESATDAQTNGGEAVAAARARVTAASDAFGQCGTQILPRLLNAVRDKRRPASGDIEELSRAAELFDTARSSVQQALTAVGMTIPEDCDTLEEFDEALAYADTVASTAARRARLALIGQISYSGSSQPVAQALASLQSQASELAISEPDEASALKTEGLIAFDELVTLVADSTDTPADPALVGSLQQRAQSAFPDHAAVVIAAMIGQLRRNGMPPHSERPAEPGASPGANDDSTEQVPDSKEHADSNAPAREATAEHDGHNATPGAPDNPADTQQTQVESHRRSSAVTDGVADLIAHRRFDAAGAVAAAASWSPDLQRALQIAGLAEYARSDNGLCAIRLRTVLADVDIAAMHTDRTSRMILVPALIRASLTCGDATAGTLLQELVAATETCLATVADEVAQRAVKSVFSGGVLRHSHADPQDLEKTIREASQQARALIDRKPRLPRQRRGADIAHRWLAPEGLLGSLLQIAARDQRNRAQDVRDEAERLLRSETVHCEISAASTQGHGRRALDNSAVTELAGLVDTVVAPVADWANHSVALARRHGNDPHARWIASELAGLRSTITSRRHSVEAALTALAKESTDPLLTAAATAACDSLRVSFDFLIEGTGLGGVEPPAQTGGVIELLRVPDVRIVEHDGVVLGHTPSPARLLEAFSSCWEEAFGAHLVHENFAVAGALCDLVRTGRIEADRDVINHQRLDDAVARSREQLTTHHDQLCAQLRLARRHNELSEHEDAELAGRLKDADPADPTDRLDLAAVRAELDGVTQILPSFREEAVRRLRARLEQLQPCDPRATATIEAQLDNGELSVAEELIYFLEAGEPFPEYRTRNDLSAFFPHVPDALTHGITPQLLAAIRGGRRFKNVAALDFSNLSPDARLTTAEALQEWAKIREATPEQRWNLSDREQFRPVLRILGYDVDRFERLKQLARSAERRFIQFNDVRVNGQAMVPAFGSHLQRLRILLVWGKPSEEQIMSWADHDPSNGSLLVLYFGVLSTGARRRLATRAAQGAAPVIVIDDAALAYLAAKGEGQLDATMSVTLPFAAVNPYVNVRRGLVAPEMFHGRVEEQRAVLDPEQTSVLYGGRGLGKSALLRACAQRFERAAHHVAIYLDLNSVFGTGQQAEAVWDSILTALQERGVVPARRNKTRSRTRSYDCVRDGISTWLNDDGQRRLLILLDESDRFFESDAPSFVDTTRLKQLGQDTSPGPARVKIVFAGLHTVQRFSRVNTNGPFSHLGSPIVIGPLSPQGAFDLIARPLAALGYQWEDLDLINRVLTYCSYQPFLLQMFGYRLLQLLQAERGKNGLTASEPPYTITRAHIEAVESDPELKTGIHRAFKDTLNLDPCYKIIAHVVAHHAYEHGADARLSDADLRAECQYHWPRGFSTLPAERFRAYLDEMVGLGVLAPRSSRGWRLRSPNTLRMIGTHNEVMEELLTAEETSLPPEFIALETRHPLSGRSTHSPLSARQITDLLGEHNNQIRVVIGSEATGISDVSDAIKSTCAGLGARFMLEEPPRKKHFKEALAAGHRGERRIVLSDLRGRSADTPNSSLEQAEELLLKTSGATRSVVLIVGPSELEWWSRLQVDDHPNLGLITLARHTVDTLRVWTLTAEKFADRHNELYELTSGWPILVERAAQLAHDHSETRALKLIADEVAAPDAARKFLADTGISEDETLSAMMGHLLELINDPVTEADLYTAAAMTTDPSPTITVQGLITLGAFDIKHDTYAIDPLLRRSWQYL
ncbi:hypothetical protein [Saccharopolyspora hattusasensis]|uniref:hypothetical protein n=1 Tax=Saccharopolyspora hattusasensis TaxID=1128679 RepID=UPI003D97BDDB